MAGGILSDMQFGSRIAARQSHEATTQDRGVKRHLSFSDVSEGRASKRLAVQTQSAAQPKRPTAEGWHAVAKRLDRAVGALRSSLREPQNERPTHLLAGCEVVPCQVQDERMMHRSSEELIDGLKGRLRSIEDQFLVTTCGLQTPREKMLGVFLAPEWHFRRSDRPYSAQEKEAVVAQLERLSEQFPDIVIIPGSIVWTPDDHVVHNTTFALFGGHLVHEYDKSRCAGDLDPWSNENWQFEARQSKPFFEARGVRFALEICLDHGLGVAREATENRAKDESGPEVDAHILISAGMSILHRNLASDNQLVVLHCDSLYCMAEAGRADSRGWKKRNRLLVRDVPGETYHRFTSEGPDVTARRKYQGWRYAYPPQAATGEFWGVHDEPLPL